MSEPFDDNNDAPVPETLSTAARMFPSAASVFHVRPKPVSHIKDDCYVVLDANVLLHPYRSQSSTLEAIRKTYAALIAKRRLYLPEQAVQEFAKNRSAKLSELYNILNNEKSKLTNREKINIPLIKSPETPILESMEQFKRVLELQTEANEAIKEAAKKVEEANAKAKEVATAIGKVMQAVRDMLWDDPVSLMYEQLFEPDIIIRPNRIAEDILRDHKIRFEHGIPPGYKDSGKPDGGIGDLLIWFSILDIARVEKKHILFVTGETKPDWWDRDGESDPLYPRFSLVEEFYRESGGYSLHFSNFADFLKLFDVADEVVEEVRQEQKWADPLIQETLAVFGGEITDNLFTLDDVYRAWPRFLNEAQRISKRTEMLLVTTRPDEVSGGVITIICSNRASYEQLNMPKQKEFARRLLARVLGIGSIGIKFALVDTVPPPPERRRGHRDPLAALGLVDVNSQGEEPKPIVNPWDEEF